MFLMLSSSEILNSAHSIMQFISVSTFTDSISVYGNEVLTTIGAQKYGMIFYLVCYYGLGVPLGYLLLLKAELKVLGN